MSTADLYDIPDFLKEKLIVTGCRDGKCNPHEENMPSCRDGRCSRQPYVPLQCNDGECRRPPYPNYPYHPCPMGGMCKNPEKRVRPVPYYRKFPFALQIQEEVKDEIDMEKMRERYPENAKKIMECVDEALGRLNYDGSMIYDEYPDQLQLNILIEDIFDKLYADNTECSDKILKELIAVILYQQIYIKRCNNRKCKECM